MNAYRIVTILTLMALSSFAGAQSAGTTTFEFLKTQYSARGAAMSNNLLAVKGDVNALFINPAVLSGIKKPQWSINYVDHLLDFQAGQLAYTRPLDVVGNVAVGLLYFNYGDFEETNQFGETTGRTFSASEFALATSISNHLGEGFDYGLSLKFIYSSLDSYNATGLALDAGLFYTAPYLSNTQFGFAISNLGFVLSNYTNASNDKLPLFLRFGFAKKLEHLPLLFTASLNDLTLKTGDNMDFIKRFSIGGEFDISEVVKLRVGYDNGINRSVKPLQGRSFSGVSAGLGIYWKSFRLDYAFSTYGDLGTLNRLGVSGNLK